MPDELKIQPNQRGLNPSSLTMEIVMSLSQNPDETPNFKRNCHIFKKRTERAGYNTFMKQNKKLKHDPYKIRVKK